ncbi:MAG: hypothetical protein M1483_08365 [Actinobacteria bacterium]|nr:hypothetical protein [Actinomycetota bacterium]
MSTIVVRRIVAICCLFFIAGMISGAIEKNLSAVMTFGLLSLGGISCLIVATAVSPGPSPEEINSRDTQARKVEAIITQLTATDADEQTLRKLVGEAIKLGRYLQ